MFVVCSCFFDPMDALTNPNGRQRSFQTAPAHCSHTDALHYNGHLLESQSKRRYQLWLH